MTIHQYLGVIRRRWQLAAAAVVVVVGAAAAITWLITPKYEATAQLFVSANDIGDLASSLQQGAQFSQDRVQSYADIIDSPHITGPVAARLNVGLTAKQISDEISADAPLNTVLVNVHVTDPSAKRAQLIANAVSAQFATYAAELEATAGKSAPPVKVTVVKEAPLPTSPVTVLSQGFLPTANLKYRWKRSGSKLRYRLAVI